MDLLPFVYAEFYQPCGVFRVLEAEDFEAFSHAVRGVADDAVPGASPPDGRVGEIRGEEAAQLGLEPVLRKVARQALGLVVALAAHAPAVNVAAPADGAEMGAGDGEGARADKGVVEELPRRGEGDVCGDEGELGVHAGGGDVAALLEVVPVDDVAGGAGDEAAEADHVRVLDLEGHAVEGPELEDGEGLVRVGHADGAVEGEVAEGVDDGEALLVGVGALVGVDDELEGAVLVPGPQVGGLRLDDGVQGGEGGRGAPELVDGVGEDGAPEELLCGVDGGELDDAEGRLGGAEK